MNETSDIFAGFTRHQLDGEHLFWTGRLPHGVAPEFEALWAMHPEDFHFIRMHGRSVATPRWQQAYGRDYHYSGGVNSAQSVPTILEAVLAWARQTIDRRLNGLLLNWYDGNLGHYIGGHRDSTVNMVVGAPIATISVGEKRIFRLMPYREAGWRDFEAEDGTVFILPFDTNRAWTHEVPKSKLYQGRRVSITLRAFDWQGRAGVRQASLSSPRAP